MVIAVDFDGTCVTHAYPEMGKPIGAEYVLKALVDAGHKIILHTMRSFGEGNVLHDAIKWFDEHNIPLYGVNTNPSQKSWTQSDKVYANLYIDDAGVCTPLIRDPEYSDRWFVDWIDVTDALVYRGVLDCSVRDSIVAELMKMDVYKYGHPDRI